jgi:hypothetical protein
LVPDPEALLLIGVVTFCVICELALLPGALVALAGFAFVGAEAFLFGIPRTDCELETAC